MTNNGGRRRRTKIRVKVGGHLKLPKFQIGVNVDVAYLRSIVNVELKQLRVGFTSFTVPAAGNITHLSPIAQSSTDSGRTGNTILPKYINARLCMLKNAANSDITDIIRLIFFMWKENTIPVVGDVLETANVFGHYNKEHKGGNARDRQLTILYDKSFTLIKDQRPCINIFTPI